MAHHLRIQAPWVALALAAACLHAADGTAAGHARYARLIDRPALGYVEMYEWNLFLSPFAGTTVGPSRRLGAPPGQPARGDGYYAVTDAAGLYSLYVNQPEFFARPIVIPDVTIQAGRTTTRHVSPAMDFCCNFTDTWALPWQDTWYQTFTARGTAITGVSFRLAGTAATDVEVALLEVVDGLPPAQWPDVAPSAKTVTRVGALGDNWVKWRSGIAPTIPGAAYAVRLRGTAGGDRKFSPFNRAKDAQSTPGGRAYDAAGAAQAYDLNMTVFSDSDGVVVTTQKTTPGPGELRDGFFASRWGHTFTSIGSSLAAVDVWAAGADHRWDLDFTFTVRENGPNGKRIGPAKTTKAAYLAFGAGLHAVSYNPGEVSLVPGRTYYVEFTNPEGFNPYVRTAPQDAYPGGAAFQNGVLRDGGAVDLSITVLEYAPGGGRIQGTVAGDRGQALAGLPITVAPGPYGTVTGEDGSFEIAGVAEGTYTVHVTAPGFEPSQTAGVFVGDGQTVELAITLQPVACATPFRNGSFEDALTAWTPYGGARTNVESGPWFGDIEAADGTYFWGNAIHGGTLAPGGLWQRFCVEPGRRYRISAWSALYWMGGSSQGTSNRLGVDPTGATQPAAGSITWTPWHREPREATHEWREVALELDATGPFMTVFLDFLQSAVAGHQWHINCFDYVHVQDLSPPEPFFRRGDCNGDGKLDVSDAICTLAYLFSGQPASCLKALDAQDDGVINIADAIALLAYLFAGGAPPAPPHEDCGPDPTTDALDCVHYDC